MFLNNRGEVKLENEPLPYTCSVCSNTDDLSLYNVESPYIKDMYENKVCFGCAVWRSLINNRPFGTEIIDGRLFVVRPQIKRPYNVKMGNNGKEFYIIKHDGTLIKTNNLWFVGKIPEHFKAELPDTANFVTLNAFMRLKKYQFRCKSKGCWDRHHCLRYNRELEKKEQYNIVPKNHVPGTAGCQSFVKSFKYELW